MENSHHWRIRQKKVCKSNNGLSRLHTTARSLGLDNLAALGLIALGAWSYAGLVPSARADGVQTTNITITDETGLTTVNSGGLQLYYGFNKPSSTWTNLTFGSSTTIPLPIDFASGTLQVTLASPTGIGSGTTPVTTLVGPGYFQLYEFTTTVNTKQPSKTTYTFDVSSVNNFSFPSRVTTPDLVTPLNPLGNPETLSRETIHSKYKAYATELGYGNLIIGNQPSPSAFATGLSSPFTYPPGTVPTVPVQAVQAYQNILNPGQAVIPGAIKLLSNAVAADVNTSPFDSTWENFLQRVGQGSFQLYSPPYATPGGSTLPEKTLTGMASMRIAPANIFGSNAKPYTYNPNDKLNAEDTYYNSSVKHYSGLTFTGLPATTPSGTNTAYIPTPSDVTAQLLWKANPSKSGFNIIIPGSPTTATMTVSAAEAQKLQLGMFLVSSNNYFKNLSTAGPGATKSDVMITAITPNNDNSSVTLTLKSPGGNLQTTAPTNQNNAVVLFSNINDRAQANSPASVWLANTWPLNSNQPFDNEVYCGNSSTDCPLSKWVGQVKTQINQAVNWGSLAAPLPSSSTLINTVWANPANWYTFNDDQGNPAYNIYSAFWHKPDVSIPFATNTSPYDTTFGAAYGFSEDETAYTFPGSTLPTVQVPSKWDGTLVPGTNVNITLLPWLDSTPTPKPCDGVETVCWATGSGLFATATNWEASEPPSPAAPYSLISFQSAFASAGGTATNNNIPGLTAQGIEYASGAATYTIAGSPIAITGSNGFAISNESDTQQTITAPINLIGSSRLSLNVTEDSSLTLSGGLESAFGWRKAGSGLLTLDQLSRGTASTGRIAVAGGTLALNNSDLSNYAGISSARSTVIEGSGTLPGTGSGSIQGLLIPGSDAQVVGRLNFAGDLAIGLGGGAVLHNLSTDPSNSDLISATGNLSINSDRSYLSVGSVSASGSSYYIPLLTIDSTGGLSGAFSNVVGLNEDQTLVYRSTGNNRGVFLHATGSGPRPTDCILRGDPASTAAPYSTSFCGGRLIVDSGKSTANWTLESTTGSNRIDLAGFASTISFNGVFSGAGDLGFENTGPNTSGLIQLNGQNTYTGPTRIGAGTRVSVNGSIDTSSSLQVDPGGTVGGNGVLPRTSLTTGATIAPGNSIGTLTAAALDLSGGTIAAEIQGPQSDRINVTGAVTNFTGTASLIPFGGGSPFPGFTYTIVNAPASPAFATSSSLNLDQSQLSSALLRFGTTLIQNPLGNPQTFAVQWQPNNPSGATTAAMQALGNGSNNALCLATALDRALNALTSVATNNANNTGTAIGNTGFTTGQAAAAGMSAGFLEALNNLVLLPSGNQLVAAVNSLSAQPYAAFQTMGLETLKQQRESMLAQAGQCLNNGWIVNGKNAKNPLCAFALVQNSTSSIRGNSNLAAYNGGVFSSGFGLEYYPSQQWSMGVNYGYGTSYANNFSTASASVSAGVNSVNLFSQFRASEQWRVRGLLGYSNFNGSASRSIAFIGPGSSLSANPNGNGFTAALETDYAIPLTKASSPTQAMIKPLLGLAWGSYQQSGFSESGNALALSVASNTTNSFVTTAGVEFSTSPIPLSRTRNVTIRPSLLLAYQVDALANNSANKSVNAAFSQAPAVCGSCSSEAQNLGTSALNLTAGVDLQLSQSTALYVNATYNAYSNASQFGYGGGVRVRF